MMIILFIVLFLLIEKIIIRVIGLYAVLVIKIKLCMTLYEFYLALKSMSYGKH